MPERNVEGEYPYAFQGQEKDAETGMEAFELRLWDTRIGRWLTTDPYGQFHSPYLGMGNDPVNGIDIDGGWKTKWGRFWGGVGNGFRGEFYNSDVSSGSGKYGLVFEYGGGSGPGDLTGTYLATSGAGLDSWNSNQEWGNWGFTPDGQGFNVAMMKGHTSTIFENARDFGVNAKMPGANAVYDALDDVSVFATSFDLLSPNGQPMHLDGTVSTRGSEDHILSSIEGMMTLTPLMRLKMSKLNGGQFIKAANQIPVLGKAVLRNPALRGKLNRLSNVYRDKVGSSVFPFFKTYYSAATIVHDMVH